jgi:preprotein translocase subunit SecD
MRTLLPLLAAAAVTLAACDRGAVTPPPTASTAPAVPTPPPSPAPAPAAPTAAPEHPEKVLRLVAPGGATPKDLAACIAILNRRFEKASIAGRAALANGRIEVRLRDDAAVLRRAGALLVAGGHVEFREVVMDTNTLPRDAEEVANETGETWWLRRYGAIQGYLVATAEAEPTGEHGWIVSFAMTPEGADAFHAFTTRLKGRQFAVVLDGRVKQVLVVQDAIRESGMMFRPGSGWAQDEAVALAAIIASGRLPIELSLEED